jgi:alpha-1,2-mannosyltransferase
VTVRARSYGVSLAILLSVLGAVCYAARLSKGSRVFSDFYGNVWWPGHRILHGAAGFPDPVTGWPATATAAVTPFSLLPEWISIGTWTALSVGGLVGGLWIVGCRDRWALAVATLSPPALSCLVLGNMTLFLVAGVALVWAYRDRSLVSGTSAGLLVVLKIWLWPLVVFLLVTRRWRSAASAALWCAGGVLLWWALSPRTFEGFDDRSDATLTGFARWGMGLTSLVLNSGASLDAGELASAAVGLVVLIVAWRTSSEVAVFTLCIAAALLASPLVWAHYYAVLFVPIAIAAPRLGTLWFAPYLAGAAFFWPEQPRGFAIASAVSLCSVVLVITVVASWETRRRSGGRLPAAA